MENTIEQILSQIKSIFDFDITRRLFFLAGVALSVALGIGIYQWVQEPIYRPLDFVINDKTLGPIAEALGNAKISYKLNDSNSSISVPASAINQARVALSSAGIQKEEGFNFSFLNDEKKLGSSQFLENARYLRALEQDLSKAISKIQGISSAIVHIAKPESNIFADENAKTTASVIINTLAGYDNGKEKWRSLVQLVAASVPELDPTNVVVTDQYGHYLSNSSNTQTLANQEQLAYQRSLEQGYAQKIQMVLNPIMGENKVRINVNTDIDFTSKEQSKEQFDPENIIRSEQTVNENNSSAGSGGVPGSMSNQPSKADQPATQSGQSRNEIVKNYEISKSTMYIKAGNPKINRISVAIALDNEMVYDKKTKKMQSMPIAKEKLDKLTALVQSSIGFQQARGDSVTVINTSFIPVVEEPPVTTKLWEEPWFWDLIKKTIGILLGFVFLYIVYRKISPELSWKKSKTEALPAGSDNKKALISADMIRLKKEQIDILKNLVTEDPNKVVGVIKKWVAN